MTQVNIQSNILHRIMHIIATVDEPYDCLEPILTAFFELTGAKSGWFLIFEEPHLLITKGIDAANVPDVATIHRELELLTDALIINPSVEFDASLVARVVVKKQLIGVVCLMADAALQVSDETLLIMETLLNVVTVVTNTIRSDARHEKLGRNQSEFMRVVSHDLRSPLTSMQGFASMLESGMVGDLNDKQEHFIEKILSGISQLTSLVENIQDAGRFDPETGFYEMERTQCDITELVHKIITNHLLPAEKQELTLEAVIDDDIPIIRADVVMMERAITNLVDNAIKYTPNGRRVEVVVSRKNDNILIGIKDNGLGISPENQKMLFERHVRIARREHKRVKGSGLGLFIVRSVARRHGGEAWVESEEGIGSTFFISIPLNEANSIIAGNS